ncbi:MAG: membrane protein YczE [Actinomycetes bacterium]
MNRNPWSRLLPSRSVPLTRWRVEGTRWKARPTTLLVLAVGLWLFGTGEALLVDAGIGVSPWTVFAEGLSTRLPISIGAAYFWTSVVVLLLWIPLRERPGLGTLANAVIIALSLQVMLEILPTPSAFGWQVLQVLAGIACIGIGSGLYLTTNLGPGPRDGLMTGIHRRSGSPVSLVRLGIEVAVLSFGWLLGGTVGLGTVLFALLVGPSVGYGLRAVGFLAGATATAPIDENDPDWTGHPELEA